MDWYFYLPDLDPSPTTPGVSKNAGLVVVPRYFTASAVGRVLKKVSNSPAGQIPNVPGLPSHFPSQLSQRLHGSGFSTLITGHRNVNSIVKPFGRKCRLAVSLFLHETYRFRGSSNIS
jgi:hypothetical protein